MAIKNIEKLGSHHCKNCRKSTIDNLPKFSYVVINPNLPENANMELVLGLTRKWSGWSKMPVVENRVDCFLQVVHDSEWLHGRVVLPFGSENWILNPRNKKYFLPHLNSIIYNEILENPLVFFNRNSVDWLENCIN